MLPACISRGIRIITNAGGVNPFGCRAAVEALAKELGVADRVRVALVVGDDLFPTSTPARVGRTARQYGYRPGAVRSSSARARGERVHRAARHRESARAGSQCHHHRSRGRRGGHAGADDVRVWLGATDWDQVAAGVVAGHIIECGAQCTGGNFTDWPLVKSLRRIGFPIVEAEADGSFVVTKHPDTGGLVSVHTVAEQILYEIGPPAYLTPDVVARFDSVQLEQEGPDRVRVTGVRGEPAPDKLKVSISYEAGWRAFGRLMVSGPDALAKASRSPKRSGRAQAAEDSTSRPCISSLAGTLAIRRWRLEPGEVLVQFGVRDQDERKINTRFAPQVVPRALGTVPGITYIADQGRPVPRRSSRSGRRSCRERRSLRKSSCCGDRRALSSLRRRRSRAVAEALSGAIGRQRRYGKHRCHRASEAIYAWVLDHLTPHS